jgi:hypothetical protein
MAVARSGGRASNPETPNVGFTNRRCFFYSGSPLLQMADVLLRIELDAEVFNEG